jgi:sulfate adenylyltransferase subunit 2
MASLTALGLQANASKNFAEKLAHTQAVLKDALLTHAHITQASSLGAEDVVITHLLESLKAHTNHTADIFVLNTGKLHAETLVLLASSQATSTLPWRVFEPVQEQAILFVKTNGELAMRESLDLRKTCCHIRKVEPLARALHGYSAWMTGMRAEQSAARADVHAVDISDKARTKYNPLVDWTWGDVLHYIVEHNVPYNALHDKFYPSIGCEPCTRAVSLGEDFRAGRWWWEDQNAKECGLHVKNDELIAPKVVGEMSQSDKGVSREPKTFLSLRDIPPTSQQRSKLNNSHLDALEEETIFILREVAAVFERPTLLFSGGKDSLVLLKCAEKAFGSKSSGGGLPYPLLMIDTGHNYKEVTDFRDSRALELGAKLIVRNVEDSMARGTVRLRTPDEPRNAHQSVTLLEAIDEFRFDALIGGARRDEEKARAKERIFSHRDSFGQWQPKNQRPELWNLFNTRHAPDEHFRVFPISNWTELDIWQYIDRENIALPSIYYTHKREVVVRRGGTDGSSSLLVPVTPLTPPRIGEEVVTKNVRFRTVGDITCTAPVESTAASAADIVIETIAADISERGATRMDDQTSDASMEKRKKEGYF